MRELQKLQDGVSCFDNQVARDLIETELGQRLESVFSEFSKEPIAAASLAQVYRARLRENGIEVAVKVQRPDALTLCSKDMYVLQRAVGVYQGIMQRWTAQNVDYNALLQTFATGFYEELDFELEGRKQELARQAVLKAMNGRVYVPKVFLQYTTRRVLVSEFVYGTKLTQCEPGELRRLTAVGQECFLQQLLEPGQFLHADPHGGNLLKPDREATQAAAEKTREMVGPVDSKPLSSLEKDLLAYRNIRPELLLLDFGLTASVPDEDKPKLVLSIVHMSNKDWPAVTEDFVSLGFLPGDIDRSKVSPLLERVLAPYVTGGGGAKAFMGEGVFSASFQNLMRDLSQAAVEIPFSIPAYWPIIGRSVAILEGIALTGDPDYKIVLSSYPYVTRKLLRENGEESFRTALNAILYPRSSNGARQPRPSPRRIAALINSALGREAVANNPSTLLDLDGLPSEEDAASFTESVAFLGREDAKSIRCILVEELVTAGDLLLRRAVRQLASSIQGTTSVQVPGLAIPFFPRPRLPVFNPISLIPESIRDSFLDKIAPSLSAEDSVYVNDITELLKSLLGIDVERVATAFRSPQELISVLSPAVATQVFKSGTTWDSTMRSAKDSGDRSELADLLVRLLLPSAFTPASARKLESNPTLSEARNALKDIAEEVLARLQKIQQSRLLS